MLERDDNGHYTKRVSANKEFVDGVRDLISNKSVEIIKSEGNITTEVSKMVEDAVKNDILVDSRK